VDTTVAFLLGGVVLAIPVGIAANLLTPVTQRLFGRVGERSRAAARANLDAEVRLGRYFAEHPNLLSAHTGYLILRAIRLGAASALAFAVFSTTLVIGWLTSDPEGQRVTVLVALIIVFIGFPAAFLCGLWLGRLFKLLDGADGVRQAAVMAAGWPLLGDPRPGPRTFKRLKPARVVPVRRAEPADPTSGSTSTRP
jgi:hypothetical protein